MGTPAALILSRAAVFEPIWRIALAGGPMKAMPGALAGVRERRVLAEEAVAGVDGVAAGLLRGVDDLVDAEVALGRRGGADRVRLVGDADVERGAVGVGVDGDGGDAHLVERARDANGDLAAVGDEDLAEGLGHGARD